MTNDKILARALAELKTEMQTTDAEWPDVTWRISQAYRVEYEALADAYDEDQRARDDR